MNKMQMAHDMALAIQGTKLIHDMELVSSTAWKYADAMQAEAEKREDKARPEVLKEWQPDWSQAPDNATSWTMRPDGECIWWNGIPVSDGARFTDVVGGCHTVGHAPSFNYTGNWKDSLRKRPQ